MRRSTDYIFIHCSASKPSMDIGAAEIDRWHRQRGWLGIGYHFVIRRDGTVEKGRDLYQAGAHAVGYNDRSVAICMVGGIHETEMQGRWPKPEDNFTEAQWEALDTLVDQMQATFPGAKVIGHNEVADKACPAFDVQKWMRERKLDEANNDGRAGPASTTKVVNICAMCGKMLAG